MKKILLETLLGMSAKLFKILITICIFSGVSMGSTTKAQSIEDVEISISLKNAKLTEVFREIEKKTEFRFVYDRNVINSNLTVSIHSKKRSVRKILDQITQETGLLFRQDGVNISVNSRQLKSSQNPGTGLHSFQIKGRVVDKVLNEPLPGVNILIKGTERGTTTDTNGEFSLDADEGSILIITFIGYEKLEQTVNTQTYFEIALSPEVKSLNEVVVIGYGAQDRKDVTTSISSAGIEDLKDQPVTSFDQAVAGKMAGVRVAQVSGAPGAALQMRVRGTNSITAGNDPLYVIDGTPISVDIRNGGGEVNKSYPDQPFNPLSSININDIESIEVLKDASAAAIYGSRGSNGVVLITTKKGTSKKTEISYATYFGVQSSARKLDLLNAYEYAQFKRDAQNNAYLDAVSTGSPDDTNDERTAKAAALGLSLNQGWHIPTELEPYLQGQEGLTNTDWQDAILRDATIQSHTLSATGGNRSTNYYLSGTYLNQNGIVINTGYKLYSTRINLNTKTSDRLRFGINFNPSYEIHTRVNSEGHQGDDAVISTALITPPIWPVYAADGSYNWDNNLWGYRHSDAANAVALANEITNKTNHARLLGNAYAEFDFLKDFTYRLNFGVDLNFFTRDYYKPSTIEKRGQKGPSEPLAYNRNAQFTNWLNEQTLNYDKTVGEHHIVVLAGYTAQKERQESAEIFAGQFPNDLVQSLNAGVITSGGTRFEEWSLLSYLGRVQYDYAGKYLLSATLRRDGSSRFGSGNKWGSFPSVSAGWRISDEEFMTNFPFLSDLKIRASYGLTGNFQIPNYGSIGLIGKSNYVLGTGDGTSVNGLAPITSANPGLKWEKTRTLDIGMDLGIIEGRFYLTADYYDSRTSDLLLSVPVPESSGFSSLLQNIGVVDNKGFEVTLTTSHAVGKLSIKNSLNLSTNRNSVVSLGPGNADIVTLGGANNRFITRVGEPVGSYYTLVQDGILRDANDVSTLPIFAGSRPGDFKFKDLSGDGSITVNDDATITGSYLPAYTIGFNTSATYAGFDLGVSVQSVQGSEIYNLLNRYIFNIEGNMNNVKGALNRWSSREDIGNGKTNRASRFQTGGNSQFSTWHVEDGSFTRIRNITLGYTFPSSLVEKLKLANVRLYLSAQNPFTFTGYTGYNPEVNSRPDNALSSGEDYGTYPLAKTFSIGASVTFK